MNEFGRMKTMHFDWPHDFKVSRASMEAPETLTLSPQMLYVRQPNEPTYLPPRPQPKPLFTESPPSFSNQVSSDSRRRKSTSPTSSSPKRRKSESPISSPAASQQSTPEPSMREKMSQMSAAPFASSGFEDFFSTTFGLGTIVEDGCCGECLACGYRYLSVEQLADHQRISHGLADVIC